MKVAILSDIHENSHNLFLAMEKIKEIGCDYVLGLGDFISPSIIHEFLQLDIPVHCIWGNDDGDKINIMKICIKSNGQITFSDKSYDSIELGGKKIFMSHFDDIVYSMAKSGDFDLVTFGHTHKPSIENVGETIVLNPGEIAGNFTPPTFAVYDTKKHMVDFVDFDYAISIKKNTK